MFLTPNGSCTDCPRCHSGLCTASRKIMLYSSKVIGRLLEVSCSSSPLEDFTNNPACFEDLGPNVPVRDLTIDMIGERVIPHPDGILSVPLYPHERVEWGFSRTGRAAAVELRAVVDRKESGSSLSLRPVRLICILPVGGSSHRGIRLYMRGVSRFRQSGHWVERPYRSTLAHFSQCWWTHINAPLPLQHHACAYGWYCLRHCLEGMVRHCQRIERRECCHLGLEQSHIYKINMARRRPRDRDPSGRCERKHSACLSIHHYS